MWSHTQTHTHTMSEMMAQVLGEAAQSSRLLLCEATRKARWLLAIFPSLHYRQRSLNSAGSPEKLPASGIHAIGQDLSQGSCVAGSLARTQSCIRPRLYRVLKSSGKRSPCLRRQRNLERGFRHPAHIVIGAGDAVDKPRHVVASAHLQARESKLQHPAYKTTSRRLMMPHVCSWL